MFAVAPRKIATRLCQSVVRAMWGQPRGKNCLSATSFHKNGLLQSKDRPNQGVLQSKPASEAYRTIGGVARNSIANRAIVGH